MKKNIMLHILRNPGNYEEDQVLKATLAAADLIESHQQAAGLKDHQIARLVNKVRDRLKEGIPSCRDVGCLREIVAGAITDYLDDENLMIDHKRGE